MGYPDSTTLRLVGSSTRHFSARTLLVDHRAVTPGARGKSAGMTECADQVTVEGDLIRFTVVRSRRRRKTITITIDETRGVVVAAPVRTSEKQVRELVRKRAAWIRGHLAVAPAPRRAPASGDSLPFLGRNIPMLVRITPSPRPAVALADREIQVLLPDSVDEDARPGVIARALDRWYHERARDDLATRTAAWSQTTGTTPTAVLVRNQRRRWGSCGADGTLRFNWRLVMAPPEVVDYVVVHELVHIRVPNHSLAFWSEVERYLPDYRALRARLKEIGPTLAL